MSLNCFYLLILFVFISFWLSINLYQSRIHMSAESSSHWVLCQGNYAVIKLESGSLKSGSFLLGKCPKLQNLCTSSKKDLLSFFKLWLLFTHTHTHTLILSVCLLACLLCFLPIKKIQYIFIFQNYEIVPFLNNYDTFTYFRITRLL